MTKLSHQQSTSPVDNADVATKEWVQNLGIQTAAGDYLVASLSAQWAAVVSTTIPFDTVSTSRGLSLTSGVVTLRSGRTYQLIGQVATLAPNDNGFLSSQWYDITNASYVGGAGLSRPHTYSFDKASNSPVAIATITPTADIDVALRVKSTAASMNIETQSWVSITEIGAAVVESVGGLEYMDTIEVTGAPAVSVTFGAGGDGSLGRALDGDVDEIYELLYYWPKPNLTTQNLEIHPNGTDVGSSSGFDRHVSTGTADNGSGWVFCRIGTAGAGTGVQTNGYATIFAKTGKQRALVGSYSANAVGGSALVGAAMHAGWYDDSTPITSLKIINEADNLPVGTRLVLYRRTPSNLRADSANTYERRVEGAVEVGSLTTEQTTGHTAFGGSVVGLTARIEEAVTAGTVTVNLKVDGATTLSTVLDTTNATSNRAIAAVGDHSFLADKNVSVEIVASSYDNAGSITSGITVVATLINEAFLSPPSNFGEQIIDTIRCGTVDSHDSDTPKAVCQFQFDPTDYEMTGATRTLVFRAVAANGGGVVSTNVRLYNLTDAEAISTLNFTSASPTMSEATLTEGSGAGEVDQSAKIYEVRIFVDSPDAVDDTIELGSAELRVINTVD